MPSQYLSIVCPVCLAAENEACRNPINKDQIMSIPRTKWTGPCRRRVHDSRVAEYEYQQDITNASI